MQTCNLEEIFSMQWIASGCTPGIFQEYVLPLCLGWALVKNLRGTVVSFIYFCFWFSRGQVLGSNNRISPHFYQTFALPPPSWQCLEQGGGGEGHTNSLTCRASNEHFLRHWAPKPRSRVCVRSLDSHSLYPSAGGIFLMLHPCWAARPPQCSGQKEGTLLHLCSPPPHLSADDSMNLGTSQKMNSLHHLKKQRWTCCLTDGESFQIFPPF